MTADNLCDAWVKDLLFSKDRGKVWELFKREQKELVEHIKNCDACKAVIKPLMPVPIRNLGRLNAQGFAKVIRETYNKSKGLLIKTD